jgi:1-acyl-sn-glycerol-3-phosphate acyltransferase
VDLSAFAGRPLDKATLSEATNVIMDAISELLATLRGGQPPLVRWDPLAHKQSSHGRFVERGGAVGGTADGASDGGTSDFGTGPTPDSAK